MLNWFKNNPDVSGAIAKVHDALEAVEVEVSKQTSALEAATANLNKETTTHTDTLNTLQDEFKRKVDAENSRFTSVKSALDTEIKDHTDTISQGKMFVNQLRSALLNSGASDATSTTDDNVTP